MTKLLISADDRALQSAFEACAVAPADFDHRAHVRLAYVYLCQDSTDQAHERMKALLLRFLRHLGVDVGKYHETVTRAWIMAVRHFKEETPGACRSADECIDRNPRLLDSRIMLKHYSAEVLWSAAAREQFVAPDVRPIPEH
jgi:hypothetical protein